MSAGAEQRGHLWVKAITLRVGVSTQIVSDDGNLGAIGARATSLEACKRIDFGPHGEWRGPARLYLNVERAYREFRNEPADAPWDAAKSFDAVCKVAKARGIEVEF
jgi:hypothetical protein